MWRNRKRSLEFCACWPVSARLFFAAVWWMLTVSVGSEAFAQVAFRAASSASVLPAISFVASGTSATANGGNITPILPSGIVEGDLLLCAVESADTVTSTSSTAGWQRLYTISGTGNHRASLFYKIASSSVETNPTITHTGGDGIVGRCAAFRDVDTTTPFDVAYNASASSTDNNAANTTIETGTLTTATNNAWVLFIAHAGDNPSGLTMTTTGGFTWNQGFYAASGNDPDEAVGLFYTGPISAQAVGAVTATMNSQNGASTGVLIALRPHASAGSTLTVPRPTGTVSEDTMIATVAVSPSGTTVTAPSGWNLIRKVTQSTANSSDLYTYYKVAGLAEAASYAWSFSSGHAGAVGGISAFSGADPNFPIDAENGVATASSLNHAAPTLSTTQADSMLVTIHEYASSSTWMPNAGMTEAVEVSSRTAPNSVGLSLEMNYETRPTIGATGTRQSSVTANADSGATQSVIIKPLGGMTCFTENFTGLNGPPNSDWSVGNQGGSFGNPTIVSNRLRLTNASGSASTYATLQRLFPGAGNKVVVEFLHYAYGGSGADGIGVILSDASIAPVAGAYGGSMGYAPKRADQGGDTTHVGFAGGWIGVAIDEYGNFSSNTEGRTGGTAPGNTPDSVSIRSSGSGYTGYSYMQGTGTLSPGIDNAGSASAAPGYKYRITVDHSNAVNAMTSVERDTGSGYVYLISPFDAKAYAGQAAVPAYWNLSYTGATGGAVNIHEIASLKVCSNTQQAISLHHIELEHGGTACGQDTLTVKACADLNCTALYGGSVTVNLSYGSSTGNPANPVTFTGGQTTVTLTNGSTTTVTLGATATSPTTANPTRCFAGGVETCSLRFLNSCFDAVETGQARATPIYTKLAGAEFLLDILALNGSAIRTNYSGNVRVDLVDPTAATGNCTDTAASTLTGYTIDPGATYTFLNSGPLDDNGRRIFKFTYPKAASNVRVRIDDTAVNQPVCSSDNFSIRPSQFALSTTPALNAPGASTKLAAGSDFTFTAASGVATGYTGTPSIVTVSGEPYTIYDHTGNSDAGRVTVGVASGNDLTGKFNAATGSNASGSFQYNDVGTFTMLANTVIDSTFTAVDQVTGTVDGVNHGTAGDCVANSASNDSAPGRFGCNIGSPAFGPVGRFYPHHYEVQASLGAACNGFTYMSQDDGAETAALENNVLRLDRLKLYLDIRAKSANGSTTARLVPAYTAYGPVSALAVTGDDGGTPVGLNRLVNPAFSTVQWTDGAFSEQDLSNTPTLQKTFFFARPTSPAPPDGSFDQFAIKTTITDADDSKITSFNGSTITATNTVSSNTTSLRYGRLRLSNAFGSELLPLPMLFTAQYFKKNVGWVTNAQDNCTLVPVPTSASGLTFNAQTSTNQLAAGEVIARMKDAGSADITAGEGIFSAGDGRLRLTGTAGAGVGPGSGNFGNVTVTPVVPSYLQFKWNGSLTDTNPTGRATFGLYKGGPVIYIREIY